MSFLAHPSPDKYCEYGSAVKKLTMALQYSELSQCYTHHIELLHFTLKCPEITNDLRYRVMDMWLIESDGDIAPLLKLDCHSVVRHCLLVHATRCFSYPTLYLSLRLSNGFASLSNLHYYLAYGKLLNADYSTKWKPRRKRGSFSRKRNTPIDGDR